MSIILAKVLLMLINFGLELFLPRIKQRLNGVTIIEIVNSKRSLTRARKELLFEPELIQLIDELASEEIFFDVGANVGTYSLYAAKKGKRVVAFEPSFANSYALSCNIELNKVSQRVMSFKIALSDFCGFAPLDHHKSPLSGNSGATISGGGHSGIDILPTLFQEMCHVSTLDAVAESLSLSPALLKIDIDGQELSVLRGSITTLRSNSLRKILIEVSSKDEEDLVKSFLEPFGFVSIDRVKKSSDPFEIYNLVFAKHKLVELGED